MKSASRITRGEDRGTVLPLVNGERMSQAEFHRRYETHTDKEKIELIGGVVYVASPQRRPQGRCEPQLSTVLLIYESATPGVEVLVNATTILGPESEPQPDSQLRILAKFGGQSRENPDDYVEGGPEWTGEIAHSTRTLDMFNKRDDYRRAGVKEYLVLCVEEQEVHWFNFRTGRLIRPDREGIARSRVFPGLWIHIPALLACDSAKLMEVIQLGLGSPEHARFVKQLQAARRTHKQNEVEP